jgi:site-specific recombinase XerD
VFVSERGAPLSAPGFSRMVERAGLAANLGIKVHAHMLRHACGCVFANSGVDYPCLAGVAEGRFKGFWRPAPT